ncbi:hypothetical protein SLEP1_g14911 [Rubroshorea leprosula]|uniref:Nucleolar GTP-binding protein 1 n=1 Tax=Rubroshorea leprosula TaxID=152421 RepID=A0AAV5IUJ2_9ROSI|nr:hypothetical protein SLEP1_g14911 [Rubroshorea leprosula]
MLRISLTLFSFVPNDRCQLLCTKVVISRLRQFYMHKVKYTQQNFHEKLSTTIDEFPRLDDIHPFYGDILHVLYNKDHYKLALGQINTARNLIGKIAKDYVKLLKYGDSLYRCKSLKVAALGCMCAVIKRISPSLAYLEQIRQHMARLSSIDPNTRTILICGAQQAALFHSIKSFMNKPLILVCNKTDLQPLDGLFEEDTKLVMEMKAEALKTVMCQGGKPANEEGVLLTMSTLTEDGVIAVKNAACERLLDQRVELKMKSKRINDCLNRFHVAIPKPREQKERPTCIPQAVLEAKAKQAAKKEKRKTETDLENENGGARVHSASLRKNYILANDEWKEDIMPEILDGHNVYDFVDPDTLLRLEELEREEGLRQAEEGDEDFEMDGIDLTPEEQKAQGEIWKKKSLLIQQHRIKKSTAESRPIIPGKAKSRGRKRERSLDRRDSDGEAMDMDFDQPTKMLRLRSRSQPRSKSRPPSEILPGPNPIRSLAVTWFAERRRNSDRRIVKAQANRR